MLGISHKAARFKESVIREMTRLALQHDAVNLAQGFPNFPAPQEIKDAACEAIQKDINQYAITWGTPRLRRAIAGKYRDQYGMEVNPETEVTVACGATECMAASVLGLVNPDEQVIIFEPFYENYGPDSIIAGARPIFVSLDPQADWRFDLEELRRVIRRAQDQGGVRALILNTPSNPCGKVFSREELSGLAELAREYDFCVITDEIYEHIIYDGKEHIPMTLIPGMRDRTVTISGFSKTFSVTGWRLGYIVAPPLLSEGVRKMHDFLTVGAAAPLQEAGARALQMDAAYYLRLASEYRQRRDFLVEALRQVGFGVHVPSGAYYILVDISPLTDQDDVTFVHRLIREFGVAAVPGGSFFHRPELGRHLIRFAFCKTMDVLEQAAERLLRLR